MEKKIFIEKGDTIVFNDKDIVICGDCLEQMKRMPAKFVDVFFTSPPYNDSGTENEESGIVCNFKSKALGSARDAKGKTIKVKGMVEKRYASLQVIVSTIEVLD